MATKYLYLYIIVGSILLILGVYRLIADMQFSYRVVGSLLPSFAMFYLAYKVYKSKSDDELM
jgi:hypothetical protein